jgi:signal transduction histidine kinase/sugar lactone lactonase YvrE
MSCSKSLSQNYQLRAAHLSVFEGLPKYENFATSLDTDGYVWFSFRESISRYDGYDFKTYDRKDLGALLDRAYQLHADEQGRIWYWSLDNPLEGFQFSVLNPATGESLPFDQVFEGQVPFKMKDVRLVVPPSRSDDQICILTKSGRVYFYDGKFIPMSGLRCDIQVIDSIKAGSTKEGFWVAYHDSLYQFGRYGSLKAATKLEGSLDFISLAGNGNAIYLDRQAFNFTQQQVSLWIRKGNSPFRKVAVELPEKILNGGQSSVIAAEDGKFWFFCTGMVCVLDENGELVAWQRLRAESHMEYSPQIVSGFLQNNNILFINTYEGVFKVALLEKPFQNFLTGRSCRGIIKYGDSLLVNSYQGDAVIDLKGGYLQQSISCSPYGFGFALDEDHNLWVGNETRALCRRSMLKGVTESMDISALPLHSDPMLLFLLDGGKTLLLGSQRGLFKMETATGNLYHIKDDRAFPELSEAKIRHFCQNEEGTWIATNVGLFLLNSKAKVIRRVTEKEGLPDSQINFIHEDEEDVFWLATRESGLVRWNRNDNTFKTFSTSNGLSNNNVHCIYEDRQGKFWMSSNNGLMRFDKENYNVNTFLVRDGLPQNEFNFASHFRDESGKLYFGGLNGVTAFHPEELESMNNIGVEHDLVITSLSVLNAESGEWNDRSLEIASSGKIVLEPDEKYADLKFSLLDYQDPATTRYAWKIEGFLNDWVYQNENSIKISQLPVGNYTLRLRAQGSNGRWSPKELVIPVEIVAPFYYNWWFYLSLAVVIIGLTYLFMQWKNDNLEREKLWLEAEVNRRTAIIENKNRDLEELNAYKDRLIGMIAHDLRVPALSFRNVAGKVSYLIEKGQSDMLIKLGRSIEANAISLNQLLDNLLNWVVSQRFKPNIQEERFNASLLLGETIDMFKIHLEEKKISLHKDIHPQLDLVSDRSGLEMVIRNVLSNAVKFTGQQGRIEVSAVSLDEKLVISVTDNGIGMQAEYLEKLFALKSKSHRGTAGEPGTGIGLLLVKNQVELLKGEIKITSEPMVGTSVTISLPLNVSSEKHIGALTLEQPADYN